jgi:diguanylate cyclase (GGDEF)-like protein
MVLLLDYSVNVFAVMFLIVLFVIIKIRSESKSFSFKLLKVLIALNIAIIVFETMTWLVDGAQIPMSYFLNVASNFMLTQLGTVFAGMWLSYVDYKIHLDIKRLHKRLYYMQPALLIFIFLMVNFFTPIFFSIEAGTNAFVYGPYALFNHFTIYLILVYGIYFVFKYRHETNPYLIRMVVLSFIIPTIGSVIQINQPGVFFTWTTLALVILMTYILLETNSGNKDFLTSLYSRQYFESYTRRLIEKKEPFGIMMLDLDNFKHINDTFGHHQGDLVLIEFASILKSVCSDVHLISRLAGDEFMVVVKPDFDYIKTTEKINDKIKKHGFQTMSHVSFSYGFKNFEKNLTMDKLYIAVDQELYTDKNKKR